VHCITIADDGLVYVCDRNRNRVQVFRKDGTFVKEWFYEKNSRDGTVFDLALWPDPKQSYLLNADGTNQEIRVIKRDDGTVVGTFGHSGRSAGQFALLHVIAVDKSGNVYTGEVEGKRVQKFKLTNPDALR
jgi:DNA-binding beta-propeller fold protein YncE